MITQLNNTHNILKSYLQKWLTENMVVVDMTVGRGKDTEFLLENKVKFLYGFDIQEEALENVKRILSEKGYKNFKLFLNSHERLDLIEEEVSLFVYNLGYLPGGDKKITTEGKTVIRSLRYALDLLKKEGMIWITLYPGHLSGQKESREIEDFLKNLDQRDFNIIKLKFLNQRNNPPYLIVIEKRRK